MTERIKSTRIILEDKIISGYVYFSDGLIIAVTDEELPFDIEKNFGDLYISPGFVDIHTHGGGGYDFKDGAEAVICAANTHLRHGTTSILPTLSAAPIESIKKSLDQIREAKSSDVLKANLIGAHVEGPYFNPEYCGAQNTSYITPPISEEYIPLLSEYSDVIKRISYAPELDTGNTFLREMRKYGIVASAGHTGARYSDMERAISDGLNLVTHLYSCTSTVTREGGFRFPGVIETALLRDDLYAEIIADGKHLPYELIRLVVKAKGRDRVALITDSLYPAGIESDIACDDFIIEDGVCKLPDRSAFAGSICLSDRCVREVVLGAGLPIEDAIYMISTVPCRIIGLNKGSLKSGFDADIVAFDNEINVKSVIVAGKEVYTRE